MNDKYQNQTIQRSNSTAPTKGDSAADISNRIRLVNDKYQNQTIQRSKPTHPTKGDSAADISNRIRLVTEKYQNQTIQESKPTHPTKRDLAADISNRIGLVTENRQGHAIQGSKSAAPTVVRQLCVVAEWIERQEIEFVNAAVAAVVVSLNVSVANSEKWVFGRVVFSKNWEAHQRQMLADRVLAHRSPV